MSPMDLQIFFFFVLEYKTSKYFEHIRKKMFGKIEFIGPPYIQDDILMIQGGPIKIN